MTNQILEAVAEHLGLDVDELEPQSAGEQSLDSIAPQWNSSIRNLGHLNREARRSVLQNRTPIEPLIIDGCEVRLYEEVQARKGEQRKIVAVVDTGDERVIFSY